MRTPRRSRTLGDLTEGLLDEPLPRDLADLVVRGVGADSRDVAPGWLFVAVGGTQTHGIRYLHDALGRGAVAAAVPREMEREGGSGADGRPAALFPVPEIEAFLPEVLRRFYDDPSRRLRVIGVTGTNGKTTVTYLLESILAAAGRSTGVFGTVAHRGPGWSLRAANTTPGISRIHHDLARLADDGVPYCCMEVSSHALDQGRTAGIRFRTAVFTNLASDHLDYHGDREAYFRAKLRLFADLDAGTHAVLNADDAHTVRIRPATRARILTYGLAAAADVRALDVEMDLDGVRFGVRTPLGKVFLRSRLIGRHNVSNILAAAAVAVAEGLDLAAVRRGVEALEGVPGRLEPIPSRRGRHVFVDYAHTEDALENVLASLRPLSEGRILLVFGCGGDRDREKRPKMGRVAATLADWSFITTDNPRGEDPGAIAAEIVTGFPHRRYTLEPDRRRAVERALAEAAPGDVVLIAGKGHEDYQIFADRTVAFDERAVVRECVAALDGEGEGDVPSR